MIYFLYVNEQITFLRCFYLYFVIVIKILLDSLSYFVFGRVYLLFAFLAFDVSHNFQITNKMMVFNKIYTDCQNCFNLFFWGGLQEFSYKHCQSNVLLHVTKQVPISIYCFLRLFSFSLLFTYHCRLRCVLLTYDLSIIIHNEYCVYRNY